MVNRKELGEESSSSLLSDKNRQDSHDSLGFSSLKEKMRPARDEEVADELGVDLEAFFRMLDESRGVSIISEEEIFNIVPQNQTNKLRQEIYSGLGIDPMDFLNLAEVKTIIAQAIEKLPKKL